MLYIYIHRGMYVYMYTYTRTLPSIEALSTPQLDTLNRYGPGLEDAELAAAAVREDVL